VIDLRGWIDDIAEIVHAHESRPGAYRRWTRPENDPSGGINPYGCADAANLLYTIGRFPGQAELRRAFVGVLQSFQETESGLFREATHHEIHTTAHCIGALELFESRPLHPLRALLSLTDTDEMERFLDGLEWRSDPWHASHRGAGLYAALVGSVAVSADWEDRFFDWIWEETDPSTGLLRRDRVEAVRIGGLTTRFPHLAGTFHYLFCLEHARRPLRYPDRLVDTCLELFETRDFPLGISIGFAEIDWVYCLTRSLRQSGHRFSECRAALERFARPYLDYLLSLDLAGDPGADDLHRLFGALCALAEIQRALPGLVRTDPPLRLVLDRRPFV
jgi:hypothetical protein